jgi:hypothetical protein
MPEDGGGFFGEGSNQWYILIPLIALIVVSFVMRRRRSEKTPQDIVASLLLELNGNNRTVEQVAEGIDLQKRPRKLKTGSWKRNSEKVDFLDTSLRSELASFYKQAEDYNMHIESAKRYQSVSYLSGISVERLKEPLAKSRQGLEDWIKSNMQQPGAGAGRPGCMGGGLGG